MFNFKSSDNKTTIQAAVWKAESKPIGVIQLVHGITEYMGRYDKVAQYFTSKGYVVCGIDIIGHGHSLQNGSRKAYLGKKGSWEYVVKDVHTCYTEMKKRYPKLPYYIVGFSMGSFIVRDMLLSPHLRTKIDGCFLIGTGSQPRFILKAIRSYIDHACMQANGQNCSPLIQFIAFGMYNNKIKNATSRADWLLYNEEERDKYLNDPHIPAQITASLMYELLSGMINCVSKKAKTASLAPVYILSGSDDAVSEYGKNIKTTVNLMTKQGFNIKDIVIFNNMRHDILHEKDNIKVLDYIYETITH